MCEIQPDIQTSKQRDRCTGKQLKTNGKIAVLPHSKLKPSGPWSEQVLLEYYSRSPPNQKCGGVCSQGQLGFLQGHTPVGWCALLCLGTEGGKINKQNQMLRRNGSYFERKYWFLRLCIAGLKATIIHNFNTFADLIIFHKKFYADASLKLSEC